MPRIIDNIEVGLAEDLRAEMARGAVRLDAAIGYFNLRGWRELADADGRHASNGGLSQGEDPDRDGSRSP